MRSSADLYLIIRCMIGTEPYFSIQFSIHFNVAQLIAETKQE